MTPENSTSSPTRIRISIDTLIVEGAAFDRSECGVFERQLHDALRRAFSDAQPASFHTQTIDLHRDSLPPLRGTADVAAGVARTVASRVAAPQGSSVNRT